MTSDQRPPILLRMRPAYLVVLDVLVGVVLALVVIVSTAESTPLVREPVGVSALLGAAMGLPLMVRRRWPELVLAVVTVAAVLAVAARWLPVFAATGIFAALAYAVYPVAATRPLRRSLAALLLPLVGVAGAVALAAAAEPLDGWDTVDALLVFGLLSVVPVAAWTIGRSVRAGREFEARAAERALADERLRIARDLHDGIAHSLSLITVQASVANHVADERPEEARSALAVIETASRDALRELRRMLGLLRSPEDGRPDDPELEPAPTADRLAELAQRASTAGVRVDLQVSGIDGLPSAVGLSVYRIVQESLTNVVKHAAPARCRVRVTGTAEAVEVEVVDDGGRTPEDSAAGHGLIGMRERVSLFAGEFDAGPVPGGGFRVYARLPLETVAA